MNVQHHIMPQLQELFQYLEKDFSPLQLCAQVNTIFEFLQENVELELSQYIKPLQEVAIVRLLKQVSNVLAAKGFVSAVLYIMVCGVYLKAILNVHYYFPQSCCVFTLKVTR